MASDYSNVVSGGLKLKRHPTFKKTKASDQKIPEALNIQKLVEKPVKAPVNPKSEHRLLNKASLELNKDIKVKVQSKTDAEKAFQEIQRKRVQEQSKKLALKSHKEKVAEFNKHLESLSEHHDIPKVGPG